MGKGGRVEGGEKKSTVLKNETSETLVASTCGPLTSMEKGGTYSVVLAGRKKIGKKGDPMMILWMPETCPHVFSELGER